MSSRSNPNARSRSRNRLIHGVFATGAVEFSLGFESVRNLFPMAAVADDVLRTR